MRGRRRSQTLQTAITCAGFAWAAASLGCAGGGGGGGATTPTGTPVGSSYEVNQAVLGTAKPNILKGMLVAARDDRAIGYVCGIMTRNLAVIDLSTGALQSTFPIVPSLPRVGSVELQVDSRHDRVWLASEQGTFILLVDPTNQTVVKYQDTSGDISSGAPDYPVQGAALDQSNQRLYLVRADGGSKVAVYDTSLTSPTYILKGKHVVDLRWDPTNDALVALTAPVTATGTVWILPGGNEATMTSLPLPPLPAGTRPPNRLAVDASGDVYVAGTKLWRLQRSDGSVLWSKTLGAAPAKIEVSGSELGLLQKYGAPGAVDDYLSRLDTYAISDGTPLDSRYTGYETSHMVPVSGGGFLVGNAGGGSVGIFPTGTQPVTEVKVGSAAEDAIYTADGRALLLNRLGGSQLIELDPATGATRIREDDVVGAWPIRMAARPASDRLFILSHFQSKLSVLGLTDLAWKKDIPLGQADSLSDTISDLAVDASGDLLCCLLSEKGVAVVVDGKTESKIATATLGPVKEGAGPGRIQGAVDAAGQRAFIYLRTPRKLYRIDAAHGYATTTASVLVIPSVEASGAYGFASVYYSPSLHKVMVYDRVVDPDTLAVEPASLPVHRVLAEHGGLLYGERHETNGDQVLVTLSASTLTETRRDTLANYESMGDTLSFDFARMRFIDALAADSKVLFFDLPVR